MWKKEVNGNNGGRRKKEEIKAKKKGKRQVMGAKIWPPLF